MPDRYMWDGYVVTCKRARNLSHAVTDLVPIGGIVGYSRCGHDAPSDPLSHDFAMPRSPFQRACFFKLKARKFYFSFTATDLNVHHQSSIDLILDSGTPVQSPKTLPD